MRPDGTLENFDELGFITSDVRRAQVESATSRQRHPGNVAADIPTFITYIEDALKLWQAHFLVSELDPWVISFPFARYIREGSKIKNVTRSDLYSVENTQKDDDGDPTGVVWLKGEIPPKRGDRLQFMDTSEYMRFLPEWSTSNAPSVDTTREFSDGPGAWTDTITHSLERLQPGSLGSDPFGDPKEIKPRFRTEFPDPIDPGYIVQVFAQRLEAIVSFSCWGKTSSRAQELASWFIQFMSAFTWVFKYNGVSEILFWQQTASPKIVVRWQNEIVQATVQYYVRTETVEDRHIRRMNTSLINLQLAGSGLPPEVEELAMPTGVREVLVNESFSATGT